jgi:hypothetical protein
MAARWMKVRAVAEKEKGLVFVMRSCCIDMETKATETKAAERIRIRKTTRRLLLNQSPPASTVTWHITNCGRARPSASIHLYALWWSRSWTAYSSIRKHCLHRQVALSPQLRKLITPRRILTVLDRILFVLDELMFPVASELMRLDPNRMIRLIGRHPLSCNIGDGVTRDIVEPQHRPRRGGCALLDVPEHVKLHGLSRNRVRDSRPTLDLPT